MGTYIFECMIFFFMREIRKLLLIIILLHCSFFSFSQTDPAELFDELCADCHSIGDGIYRGPDLLGMEQRFSEDWLISFIQSSKAMIASGDAKAVALFEEFDKKKMPNTDASVDEIKALIAYVKSFNKSAPPPEKTTTTPADKDASKDEVQTDRSETERPDVTNQQPAAPNAIDERLKQMEEKIAQLLKFHQRTAFIEISAEDILNGKKLFTGEREFKNGARKCISCHNTKVIDSLNWNPSALEIAELYSEKKGKDIEEVLMIPASQIMKETLKDHELTEREAYLVKAYLQSIEKNGLTKNNKIPINGLLFAGLFLLIIILVIDLLYTNKIKPIFIPIVIILAALAYEINTVIIAAQNIGLSQNYDPDQPIKFSHKIHSGENKISCLYCHSTPEYSQISGIPYAGICINCHYKIKSGTHSGKFEINKIFDALKSKEPIKWLKVHNLPDHVFFSHAQHVGVGKIECQVCHGKVEEMDRVKQVSSLSMKWCISCHREQEVNFNENNFYTKYRQSDKDMESGKIDKITVDDIGGGDCQKCHY